MFYPDYNATLTERIPISSCAPLDKLSNRIYQPTRRLIVPTRQESAFSISQRARATVKPAFHAWQRKTTRPGASGPRVCATVIRHACKLARKPAIVHHRRTPSMPSTLSTGCSMCNSDLSDKKQKRESSGLIRADCHYHDHHHSLSSRFSSGDLSSELDDEPSTDSGLASMARDSSQSYQGGTGTAVAISTNASSSH